MDFEGLDLEIYCVRILLRNNITNLKEIFRDRAIENALQKVLSEGNQNLNSFSLVENGKMLLDQIQSSSQVKILQYDVIQEKVKNNRYHVTLKATVDDKKDNATLNYCKKAKTENLDFS